MSFAIDYHQLFSVMVEEQSSGKPLLDWSFRPTATCQQLLADRHMIFKPWENGGQVFYQKNPLAAEPLLGKITERIQLSFILSLKRADFFDFYKPNLTTETGPHLYFDNLTASGNIQTKDPLTVGSFVQASDAIHIRPSVFVKAVDISGGTPPTFVVIKRLLEPPIDVPDIPIHSSIGTSTALTKIDLTLFPSGVYTLTTNQPEAKVGRIYIDDEIAKQPVVGVIDIFWEDSQETAPDEGVPYVLRFEKR